MSAVATKSASTVEVSAKVQELNQHIEKMRNGEETVRPGQPARFTTASTPGDTIAQGDLYVMIIEDKDIPADYVKLEQLVAKLVPGTTVGSNHHLRSLEGVEMWTPKQWDGEDLRGPVVRFSKDNAIDHDKGAQQGHGSVEIPAGFTVLCGYQPSWLAEQKKARRNAD